MEAVEISNEMRGDATTAHQAAELFADAAITSGNGGTTSGRQRPDQSEEIPRHNRF